VERTGVHIRSAGKPKGVQVPAERLHLWHHAGDRDRVRGPGQNHQTELCPQVETGNDAPRHWVPVHVRESGQHVPPGPLGVIHLVAARQVHTAVAYHPAADGQEHVHVRVLDVRAAVLGVRADVSGPAHILCAKHRHPGTGVAVLRRLRPRGHACAGR